MKLYLKLLITYSLVTSLTMTHAMVQSSTSPKIGAHRLNIAYVNTHEIITLDQTALANASDEWRDVFLNLQKMTQPAQAELQTMSDQLRKGEEELRALQNNEIVNKETLQTKYDELYKLSIKAQERNQELNKFVQDRLKNAQDLLQPKIKKALQDVAKEKGYALIIDGMCVLEAPGADNATSLVLAKLNNEYAMEKAQKLANEKVLEQTKATPMESAKAIPGIA